MSVRLVAVIVLHAVAAILAALPCQSGARAASMLDPTGRFAVQWWTVDDGLPDSTVTGIDVAPDGTLVCCTAAHIVRFDGIAFEPLPAALVVPLADAIGTFWSLGFDGEGRLWVQGSHAVARLERRTDGREGWRVHRLPTGAVTSMSIAADGTPVFVGAGLVLAWDGRRVVSLPVAPPPVGPARWRYGMVDTTTDDLWLWGNDDEGRSLFRCRTPRDGRAELVLEPAERSVAEATITLGRAPSGACSLLKDCVAVHGDEGWQRLAPSFPDAAVRESGKVVQGPDDTVWIATHAGIVACRDGRVEGRIEGLPGFPAFTYRLIVDREGGAWAACSGGLLAVRRTRVQSVAVADCRAVWPRADGALLVGVPGAVVLVPPATSGGDPATPRPLATLPDASVPTAIVEDGAGRVWIGTQDDHILRMEAGGRNLVQVTAPAQHYRELRNVTSLAADATGRVWAGTTNGLAVHDQSTDAFTPILGFEPRDRAFVVGLAAEPEGGVLVATLTRGVERVGADGRIAPVLPVGEMPGRRTLALARDARGRVWIGGDRGLVRIDTDGRATRITTAEGLVDDAVRQIADDGRGRLWIGTRDGHLQGILHAALDDLADGRAARIRGIVIGSLDGLGDGECTGRVATPAGSHHVVVPLTDGVVRLDPAAVTADAAPAAAPWIVTIDDAQPACRCGVSGLHWGEPPLVQTLIVGADASWSPPAAPGRRGLATTPPGRHELRIRTLHGETDRDFPVAVHRFEVPAPWWRRPWVAAAGIIGVATAAAVVSRELTRRRARRRISDLERQGAMDRERARIARDIHDSIGAGLTRVALASDLARRAGTAPEAVRAKLDAISSTAHGLARSVDEIVWAVNPHNDTLGRFVSYVVHDVEEAARAGDLDLQLDIPGDLPDDLPLPAQARHHLCLAVREALQNVLRHAGASRVEFAVRVAPEVVAVTVADDGAGFLPDGPRADGQDGLANMRERLAELGGDLRIDSAPGRGTRITLVSPLRPARNGTGPDPARSTHHAGHPA